MGPDLQRRVPARSRDRQADQGARALGQQLDQHVARRQVRPLLR